jgi:hypothetical protein
MSNEIKNEELKEVTIDVTPEEEKDLHRRADNAGMALEDYMAFVLESSFKIEKAYEAVNNIHDQIYEPDRHLTPEMRGSMEAALNQVIEIGSQLKRR